MNNPALYHPPRGAGLALCLVGLFVIAVSVFADESGFPSGRWPVFALGLIFFLCGILVLRVVMFHRSADGATPSAIAVVVYWAFSAILFSVAFGQGKLVGNNGEPSQAQLVGRLFFGAFAVIGFSGGFYFLVKLLRQFRKPK